MGWTAEEISKIRGTLDIVEIANRLGAELRPAEKIGLTSAIYIGRCPYHQPKDHHLFVDAAKQLFYCFGSQQHQPVVGDSIDLCYKTLGRGINRDQLIKEIIKAWDINLPSPKTVATKDINEVTRQYFEEQLLQTDAAYNYLRQQRQLADSSIRKWGLGYAPAGGGLMDYLLDRGFFIEQIARQGLARSKQPKSLTNSDYWCYFQNRIILPIRNNIGDIVGFAGRDLSGESQAKYLNTPAESTFGRTRYNKRLIVFGLPLALPVIKKTGTVIVTEGYFNVITAHQAGLENVVATGGTAFTPQQAGLLRKHAKELHLVMDGDEPGIKATKKAAQVGYVVGFAPTISLLPEGKDLDDFLKESGPFATNKFEKLKQLDIIQFTLQTNIVDSQCIGNSPLNSKPTFKQDLNPDQKTILLEKLVELMRPCTDLGRKIIWISQTAEQLGIDSRAVEEKYFARLDKLRTSSGTRHLAEPARLKDVTECYLAGLLTVPADYAGMIASTIPKECSVFTPHLRELYQLIIEETVTKQPILPFNLHLQNENRDLFEEPRLELVLIFLKSKYQEGRLKHYPSEIIKRLRQPLPINLTHSSNILAAYIKNEVKDNLITEMHQALAVNDTGALAAAKKKLEQLL